MISVGCDTGISWGQGTVLGPGSPLSEGNQGIVLNLKKPESGEAQFILFVLKKRGGLGAGVGKRGKTIFFFKLKVWILIRREVFHLQT